MAEDVVTSARAAVLQTLFRAIQSYSATSCLAWLGSVPSEQLLPIFRPRSNPAVNQFEAIIAEHENREQLSIVMATYREQADASAVAGTQSAIAAACLVFSHSLADVALEELCSLLADFNPGYWTKIISKRSFTLGKIAERGVDELTKESVRQKIKSMSLPTKMKHLLKNAGSHANVDYPSFTYERSRLAKLDASRHAVVHDEGVTLRVDDTKDSQEFFFNTTVYAALVVSSTLGLGVTYPQLYVRWLEHLAEQAGLPGVVNTLRSQ